jgi:hypothetical protein
LIGGFSAGLRGEEMTTLSLDATRKYYTMKQPKHPALGSVFIVLRGRMKGEALNGECHLIPIADVTHSGLKPQLWVGWMLEVYTRLGVSSGWVFWDAT